MFLQLLTCAGTLVHSLLVVAMLLDVSAFCNNDGSAECSEMNFLQLEVQAGKGHSHTVSRMQEPAAFDNTSACLSAVLPLLEDIKTSILVATRHMKDKYTSVGISAG